LKGKQGEQGDATTISSTNYADGITTITFSDGTAVKINDGPNGATFTPSVNSEGVISWTNDKELQNPSPVNITGPKGAPGTKFIVPTNQFTDNNIHHMELPDADLPWTTLQDGDYTISVDTQTLWAWSKDGGGFDKLFTLKGDAGANGANGSNGENGLTPFIGGNGNWWIGTEDTGVQAEGKDGKNPFTEEEVATLNALPEALNITQS
jgi:hypothetical protein